MTRINDGNVDHPRHLTLNESDCRDDGCGKIVIATVSRSQAAL